MCCCWKGVSTFLFEDWGCPFSYRLVFFHNTHHLLKQEILVQKGCRVDFSYMFTTYHILDIDMPNGLWKNSKTWLSNVILINMHQQSETINTTISCFSVFFSCTIICLHLSFGNCQYASWLYLCPLSIYYSNIKFIKCKYIKYCEVLRYKDIVLAFRELKIQWGSWDFQIVTQCSTLYRFIRK